jgi:NAD(P)-dependent dehydrogenase (short-subunit alcohol dehydrogenase family)
MPNKVIAVLGIGPGLGLSLAQRFAAEGYDIALVSRSPARHGSYLAALPAPGRAYAADLTDPAALRDAVARITKDFGRIDVAYFGPAAVGARGIVALPGAGPDAVREALETTLLPAVTLVDAVLPELTGNHGALLFAGGLSGLRPMPMLGNLAPASAALRMYVLTLHAALAERGVYAGALTIGGLVARGDIHRMFADRPGGGDVSTLDPDEIAATAWRMVTARDNAEAVFETRLPV